MGGSVEQGYNKLEVYKLAHALALRIHKMSLTLPSFERFEEGSQIRRSSKSISSNIVEGFALRKYKNEYLHYLYRAHASGEETLEHLKFLFETGSLSDGALFENLAVEYRKLIGMLFNFTQYVEHNYEPPFFLRPAANP